MSVLLLSSWLAYSATIQGKVSLAGPPPPEIEVDLTNYPDCRKNRSSRLTTRHYVTGPDGGLANVFVYVSKGLEGRKFPLPIDCPILDQVADEFQPYVMGLRAGQKFQIKNSDPFLNNVHAMPKLNREFNIAQPLKGMVAVRQFDSPEVLIRLKCEVHPWEFAFIGVVDHPFFAVTKPDGTYQLPPELPAGNYVISAVHPKSGTNTHSIAIRANETKVVNFVFPSRSVAAKP